MARHFLLVAVCLLAGTWSGLFGQMLYVGNNGDDTISAYVIDQDAGFLTEVLPRVASTGAPTSVAAHPSGKFVYVTNSGNANLGANGPSVATFSIDPTTGALTLANTLSLTPGTGPAGAAIDPSGKYLLVANGGPGNVSVFSLDATTGTPSPVAGSPFASPQGPNKVVVHPNGKFAYVAANGAGQIAAFNIGAGGALTAVTGSPFAARNNLIWMTMDVAGKFLFAAERQQNGVLVYAVDATTGALTPVTGSPFSTSGAIGGLVVDPTGKFLYTSNGGGTLNGYRIGANGALTSIPPGFYPSQIGSFEMIMDPGGQFVYVTSQQGNSITAWSIDPASGALTPIPVPPYSTGASPLRGASILLSPPVIPPIIGNAVVNYFSNSPPGMPNAAIAQGSKIGIYGDNIGPAVSVNASAFPLQTQLGGVSIQIQSGGVNTAALMIFVSNGFVSALAPSTTPLGDATVTLTYNGRSTAPLPVTIAATSVGIRTLNDNGNGPAKAWNANPDAGPTTDLSTLPANSVSQSAKPGQMMIVQGTGLGAVAADETQAVMQTLNVPVNVIVGNKQTTATLEVRVTGGADYILFQIPSDAPEGCYVPLAMQTGGVTSNLASVSISATGASCTDPAGLAASDIDTARKSGQFNVGTVILRHDGLAGFGVQDRYQASFQRFDFSFLAAAFAPVTGTGFRSAFGTPPFGTCTVAQGVPTDPSNLFSLSPDPTTGQFLFVGQTLSVNGPQGPVQMPALNYSFRSDGSITPGGYTVDNGAGAQGFGPFKASINLPPVLPWTTQTDLTAVDRTQDLTVTWSGGVADKEYVYMVGLAVSQQATGGFLCAEKVAAGQFTIPAWVLSSLPASTVVQLGGQSIPGGLLGVGTSPLTSAGRFNAPGLDFAIFTYEQDTVSLANYQ